MKIDFQQTAPLIMLILTISIASALILSGSGTVPQHPMDQNFAERVDITFHHDNDNWIFQYPHLSWSGGITGSLIVGVYKLIIPTNVHNLNWHVKILSSSLFLLGLFFLGKSQSLSAVNQSISLSIAGTSGLIYLEPSTEVMAGAMLCMFVAAIPQLKTMPWFPGVLLAIFSLIKIELVPIGFAVAFVVLLYSSFDWKARVHFLSSFMLFIFILLFPAIYLYGENAFSGRGMNAFSQHYCSLIGFGSDASCISLLMPGVHSVIDVLINYTANYINFISVSTMHSIKNIFNALNLLAISPFIFGLILFRYRKKNSAFLLYAIATSVFFITISISIAFAFVHERYMTRSLGLLIVGCLALLQSFQTSRLCQQNEYSCKLFSIAFFSAIIILNIYHLPTFLSAPHSF